MESEPPQSKGWWWWFLVLVLAALVLCASSISIWKNFHQLEIFRRAPKHSQVIVDKYANALSLSVQFFNVQKSGKLVNNKISWRGDSAMGDGKEENLDLTKGMY
ncbi:Endoglucanase 10 [Forsythia ovata]|uniref:cellulase n=1 Tax=Forsythia ovata TaxID=205694 RepID=A0ABD1U5W3_9LAMI